MKRIFITLAVITAILAVVTAGLMFWWNMGFRERVHDAAIASAHLAAIPDQDYKADTRGNVFTRTYWMSFQCSDEDFEKFVTSSPGLRDVTPYRFPYYVSHPTPTTFDQPSEHQREAMRETESFWNVESSNADIDASLWDSARLRKHGRRYEIHIPKEAIHGFLLRDDDSGEVYLRISYS